MQVDPSQPVDALWATAATRAASSGAGVQRAAGAQHDDASGVSVEQTLLQRMRALHALDGTTAINDVQAARSVVAQLGELLAGAADPGAIHGELQTDRVRGLLE